jgi:RimJ/RimL family protein N-acetyltransferase
VDAANHILSPFPAWAVPRVWVWMQQFRGRVMDDFGPRTLEEFMAEWEARQPARMSWAVLRDGEIGGLVVVDRQSPVLGATHCVFKRSFWGHEDTVDALKQIYEQAFSAGIQKLSCAVFPDNAQLIHLARRVGARREGRLKNHTLRDGKPADLLILGLERNAPAVEAAA